MRVSGIVRQAGFWRRDRKNNAVGCLNGKGKGGTLAVYRLFLVLMFHFEEHPRLEESGETSSGSGSSVARENNEHSWDYHEFHYVAARGNFEETYYEMTKGGDGNFEACVRNMESGMRELLSSEEYEEAEACLNENGKKMLALLWVYDPVVLFPHSIRTFQIGLEKFKRQFSIDGVSLRFFDVIVSRAIGDGLRNSKQLFLESLLLHDIGKLNIPASVIDNAVTDRESISYVARLPFEERNHLLQKALPKDEKRDTLSWFEGLEKMDVREREEAIQKALGNARMNTVMPIRYLDHIEHWNKRKKVSGNQFHDDLVQSEYPEDQEAMRELQSSGFSPDQTLGEILSLHEEHSKRILEKYHLYIPAVIAGHHHHSSDAESVSSEMRALFTIIQFCDEFEAMTAKRQYNPLGRPRMQALSMIVDEARHMPKKFILPVLALCIANEVSKEVPSSHDGSVGDLNHESFDVLELSQAQAGVDSKQEQWRANISSFLSESKSLVLDNIRSIMSEL